MTHWLILRTDPRKEHYVAAQIRNAGFSAWVPVQIITARPHVARRVSAKSHIQTIRELPILPRRLFIRAQEWEEEYWMRTRHYLGLERCSSGYAVEIPDEQIHAFRVAIDNDNTAALALSQRASRKQKAKWKSLHDALVEMIQGAKQTLEEAA